MSNPFEEITSRLTKIENLLQELTIPKKEQELRYFSREEVCDLFKISMPTLNTYTKKGIIRGVKIGSRMLYPQENVTEALRDATELRYRRDR